MQGSVPPFQAGGFISTAAMLASLTVDISAANLCVWVSVCIVREKGMLWQSKVTSQVVLNHTQIKVILSQVATALLAAGSTLTFWIPWQTSFASPAHTQALFKALGCSYNCMRLTGGSFQLTHTSRDDTLFN